MKRFKQLLALVCVVGCLNLVACSKSGEQTTTSQTDVTQQVTGATTITAATDGRAQTSENATLDQLYAEFDAAMKAQIGEVPSEHKPLKVGALIISTTNPFWVNMEKFYKQAAAELDIDLTVQAGTTEGDTQAQLNALLTMADQDYQVIIVSPIEGSNLIPGIVKCNEKGIKVINLGPGVDTKALEEAGGHLDAKITVDFAEQGNTVAEDLTKRIPDGKVAVLAGLAGAAQSEGRSKGFTDYLAEKQGYTLVGTTNCDWDATKAYEATKNYLSSNPDLKAIFACNDQMALAAVEALKDAGKQDVLVYGVDYIEDAKQAIKQGSMTGTMSYSSERYTKAALQMCILLNEDKNLPKVVYLPLTLITTENVNDLVNWQ